MVPLVQRLSSDDRNSAPARVGRAASAVCEFELPYERKAVDRVAAIRPGRGKTECRRARRLSVPVGGAQFHSRAGKNAHAVFRSQWVEHNFTVVYLGIRFMLSFVLSIIQGIPNPPHRPCDASPAHHLCCGCESSSLWRSFP